MDKFISINRNKKNKRGQAWSLDLIIAGVIFMIGIVILLVYSINYSSQSKNQLEEMFYEGSLASELILSEEDFGILSDKVVNQSKLDYFDSRSDDDKKKTLGVINDFYFIMDGLQVGGSPVEFVGIRNSTEVDNFIQVTRLTVYNNRPVKFRLYVWK